MILNGQSSSIIKTVPEIGETDRSVAQRFLRPSLENWCKRIIAGVEVGERTAMNNYARVMDLLGEGMEVNLHLHVQKRYGISFDELLAAYKGTQEAESGTLDDWQRDAVGVLKLVLDKEPQRRQAIMEELGARNALVEHENGGNGANGHG